MFARPSRIALVAGYAVVVLAVPVLFNGMPYIGKISAFAVGHGNAGEGNGNGNGGGGNGNGGGGGQGNGNGGGGGNGNAGGEGMGNNGNGNGGGNGNGNAGFGKAADHGNEGNGGNGGSGLSKGSGKVQAVSLDQPTTSLGKPGKPSKTTKLASEDKPSSLKSKLGGLNSLNRNINGLMNSSDPRMEGVREFIMASASLVTDGAALKDAEANQLLAQSSYDDYVASLLPKAWDNNDKAYTDTSLEGLQSRLADLTTLVTAETTAPESVPLIQDEIDQLTAAIAKIETSDQLAALTSANDAVTTLEAKVQAGQAATTDDALTKALLEAANKNRVSQSGDTYVDAAVLEWAKKKLGVGDNTGLIDAYAKQ